LRTSTNNNHVLISQENESFSDFLTEFENVYQEVNKSNIIVLLSETFNNPIEQISLFLDYANQSKENKQSFVVVSEGVDIDDFEESFNVVPTLIEAEDVVEMEMIERDLGF